MNNRNNIGKRTHNFILNNLEFRLLILYILFMPIAYYNGRFCDESEIRIAPTDRGLLLGDGVFDSMRGVQNRIVSFAGHVNN